MDKTFPFPSSSATATSSTSSVGGSKPDGSDSLRHLNKLSHKIAKPPPKKPPLDPPPLHDHPLPPHQHQPPVYNINKNDFRHVVQKLTGSPAPDRPPAPPAVPPPKLPSSRLHRIRPPPLSHLSPRPPPPLLDPPAIPSNPSFFPNNFNFTFGRPPAALSPLPPLPSVHGAAESPVSAYMRRINTSSIPSVDPKGDPFLGFRPSLSPLWSNLALPSYPGQAPPRPPEGTLSSQQQQLLSVPAPMPFGCSSSSAMPPYGLISPGFLFSPPSLGFPLSPTAMPVASPQSGGA
ncbi:hypothetical protein MLD38_034795 [Melastoma candidum]|uniref:Uncharacterized protein n=1 Tax=Melastoma candidum TaxID=119954 RepID=A0ACB9MB26_9MYRT|nr:hypothetical protein MLD38_034795 [Melastoma candidum]